MTFIIFLSHNFQRNLTKIFKEIQFTCFIFPGGLNYGSFYFTKMRTVSTLIIY